MSRLCLLVLCLLTATTQAGGLATEDRYADNAGVKIHYVVTGAAAGTAPLVVMIHGFPDFWYSWREQMAVLAPHFRIAAMDQRGYNLSDQPDGIDAYAMPNLVGDVAAVIRAEGADTAVVTGHDWGGAVAWSTAMTRPELVSHLIILNLPHPNGISREIATNPAQQKNSEYAFRFQQPDAHKALTAEGLAGWVQDQTARAAYVEAFRRSSFEGMLNFYKANYPRPAAAGNATASAGSPASTVPKVRAPVLQFHGLEDQALLPGALNDTWEWLAQDYTLVTIPGAGHFVQQDASELVSATMKSWLLQRLQH